MVFMIRNRCVMPIQTEGALDRQQMLSVKVSAKWEDC